MIHYTKTTGELCSPGQPGTAVPTWAVVSHKKLGEGCEYPSPMRRRTTALLDWLHTVVAIAGLRRVQYTEGIASVRPHQHQRVLTLGHAAERLLNISRALHRLAIHLDAP